MSMPKYYVTRSSITWTQIWFNFVVLHLLCGNVMLKFLHTSLGPWKHHIPVSLYFMGAIETSDTVHQFGKLWISGVNEFVYTPFRNQNTISIDTTICIMKHSYILLGARQQGFIYGLRNHHDDLYTYINLKFAIRGNIETYIYKLCKKGCLTHRHNFIE